MQLSRDHEVRRRADSIFDSYRVQKKGRCRIRLELNRRAQSPERGMCSVGVAYIDNICAPKFIVNVAPTESLTIRAADNAVLDW